MRRRHPLASEVPMGGDLGYDTDAAGAVGVPGTARYGSPGRRTVKHAPFTQDLIG